MTSSKSRSARVAPLAAAFAQSDLTRLAITDGEFSLELMRHTVPPAAVAAKAPAAAVTAAPAPASTDAGAIVAKRETLRAELVGVLRFVDPRASVGTVLERDREIFVIEALGVKTPVLAGGNGTIVEVFVNDGAPVEYGQPLLVIERV